jgi:hypothetical protein
MVIAFMPITTKKKAHRRYPFTSIIQVRGCEHALHTKGCLVQCASSRSQQLLLWTPGCDVGIQESRANRPIRTSMPGGVGQIPTRTGQDVVRLRCGHRPRRLDALDGLRERLAWSFTRGHPLLQRELYFSFPARHLTPPQPSSDLNPLAPSQVIVPPLHIVKAAVNFNPPSPPHHSRTSISTLWPQSDPRLTRPSIPVCHRGI